MDFLSPLISRYSEAHSAPESEVLAELNRETHAKVLMPRMLSGHLQGRILSMISKMCRPKHILEIGTYTGYSAICLAEGLVPDGKIISIDINDEFEKRIRRFWDKAGISDHATLLIGDAANIIPTLDIEFDLVFIDADKPSYHKYYDLVIDKVTKGGLILADNVLWSGKVTDDPSTFDKDTLAMDEFNKKVNNDARVENLLLPVRDGIMIARKI